MSSAVAAKVAPSRPLPDSPASASPDGLKTIRFQLGRGPRGACGHRLVHAQACSTRTSEPATIDRKSPIQLALIVNDRRVKRQHEARVDDLDVRRLGVRPSQSVQPISTWAKLDDRRAAENWRHRLLVVLRVRLVEQRDVLEEAVEAAVDDLVGSAASGLPSLRRDRASVAFSAATTSAGTSSRLR